MAVTIKELLKMVEEAERLEKEVKEIVYAIKLLLKTETRECVDLKIYCSYSKEYKKVITPSVFDIEKLYKEYLHEAYARYLNCLREIRNNGVDVCICEDFKEDSKYRIGLSNCYIYLPSEKL